jgi:hypothetical protein
MEVVFTPYPIEILSSNYQIQGELRPRGNPNIFINDAQYATIVVHSGTLKPISHGARIGPVSVGQIYLPKNEVHVMALRNFDVKEAQILPTSFRMICFTDTYVIRGAFHTGPETKPLDIFYSGPGPFYPATDIEVYPIKALNADVALKAELGYVHRDAIRVFYEEEHE